MLKKIKDLIASTGGSNTNHTQEESSVNVQAIEDKLIENFKEYILVIEQEGNIPKKAIQHLKDLISAVKDIKFDDMNIENQVYIRRILETDVKKMVELYLSIPKAHAVSVILENGQTAKDTFIENVHKLVNKIHTIWNETVEEKAQLLLRKQKVNQIIERKIDFFDQ